MEHISTLLLPGIAGVEAAIPHHSRPASRATIPLMKTDRDEFIDGYCKLYELHFGGPYPFQGGKDGAAVKRFLAYGYPVAKALEILADSFTRTGFPYDGTATIASFVSMWPHLIAAKAKRENADIKKPTNRYELRQKIDIVKMRIASHPHNPNSIKYNPDVQVENSYDSLRKMLTSLENELILL